MQPPVTHNLLVPSPSSLFAASNTKDWFIYAKMITADSYPENFVDLVPGFGVGFRFSQGHHGFDISSTGARGNGWNKEKRSLFWTFPKASYLYYFNPTSNQSLYTGGGLAWGRVETKKGTDFLGISSHATVGLEMFRKASFKTFIELNVSQPTIAREASGPFPGPIAEISVGAGF